MGGARQLVEDDWSPREVPFCCNLDSPMLTRLLHILPSYRFRPDLPPPLQGTPAEMKETWSITLTKKRRIT